MRHSDSRRTGKSDHPGQLRSHTNQSSRRSRQRADDSGRRRALHNRGVMIIPDIFLNAGGVTVSYFEWGKNLSHMRFGRLQKHLEEIRNQKLVSAIERMIGKEIPEAEKRSSRTARKKSIW